MDLHQWARRLVIAGLVLLLLPLADPLEGSLLVVPGVALVAGGAQLTRSRHRSLLYLALVLVAIGVASLWIMSAVGGVGGNTGHSTWWLLVLLPYPAGWLLALVGAVRKLREGFD